MKIRNIIQKIDNAAERFENFYNAQPIYYKIPIFLLGVLLVYTVNAILLPPIYELGQKMGIEHYNLFNK